MTGKRLKVVALVCERSVSFDHCLDESNCLNDAPEVNVVKVPCSGQIQPIMIETALKQGADGVITTGCRIGDCHYREGNKFLRARLLGERQPKLKANVDRKRINAYWLSALEYDRFKEMSQEFVQFLGGYTPPVLAKPDKPAPAVAAQSDS